MLGLSTFVNMTDRPVPSQKERDYLRYHIVKALCFIQALKAADKVLTRMWWRRRQGMYAEPEQLASEAMR